MAENGKIKPPAKISHDALFRVLMEDPGRAATLLRDWNPDRLNASQRRDMMEIVEDRYGAGSTLITS